MNFFDSLIDEVSSFTENMPQKSFACSDGDLWQETPYSQVILQRDTALELDGTGFNLITSAHISDGITLIGKNLSDLKGKCPFARISLIELEDEKDEQKAYNLIRKIEYVKYHFFPEGYMIRTTSRSHKESVRVSKKALKKGVSFRDIGSLLIKKYKEIPEVKAVKIIFITEAGFDYGKTEALARKNNSITETLNHIMNSVKFDCDTCNLKAVCDEVEGMKELHFKNATGKGM